MEEGDQTSLWCSNAFHDKDTNLRDESHSGCPSCSVLLFELLMRAKWKNANICSEQLQKFYDIQMGYYLKLVDQKRVLQQQDIIPIHWTPKMQQKL